MSNFDTLFDYSQILAKIDDKILSLESQFVSSNSSLSVLTSLDSKYQKLASSDIEYYTYMTTKLNKDITDYTGVRNEVISVQSLLPDTKNVIYEFYTTYIDDNDNNRDTWMKRLLFNIPDISSDMGNLISDTHIGVSDANCVVDLISKTYEPTMVVTRL